jgi:hypothetical protein
MRYEVKTKLSVEDVLEKALTYFGEEGVGLELEQQTACCVYFSGAGGDVSVTVDADTEGDQNAVHLETREWDYQVRQFMEKV